MAFGWLKRKSAADGQQADTATLETPGIVGEVMPIQAPVADIAAAPVATIPTEPRTPPAAMTIPAEKIAARAYEIWVEKGRPTGCDQLNWQEAETELRAELQSQHNRQPMTRKSR